MRRTFSLVFLISLLAVWRTASADWHQGTVTLMALGYDGSTVSFKISGWSRNDCTCSGSWATHMCLDRARLSFKEEYAWLLKARATDEQVNVNIDETSCKVLAIYEAT